VLFKEAKASYYEVLEAQQQLLPAENTLSRIEVARRLAVIQLYKSLGGGWETEPSVNLVLRPGSPTQTNRSGIVNKNRTLKHIMTTSYNSVAANVSSRQLANPLDKRHSSADSRRRLQLRSREHQFALTARCKSP
jgi:hypothetical protein